MTQYGVSSHKWPLPTWDHLHISLTFCGHKQEARLQYIHFIEGTVNLSACSSPVKTLGILDIKLFTVRIGTPDFSSCIWWISFSIWEKKRNMKVKVYVGPKYLILQEFVPVSVASTLWQLRSGIFLIAPGLKATEPTKQCARWVTLTYRPFV